MHSITAATDGGYSGVMVLALAAVVVGLLGGRVGRRLTSRGNGVPRLVLAACLVVAGSLAGGWGLLGLFLLTSCEAGACSADASDWVGVALVLIAAALTTAAGAMLSQERSSSARWLGLGGFAATLAVAGVLLAA